MNEDNAKKMILKFIKFNLLIFNNLQKKFNKNTFCKIKKVIIKVKQPIEIHKIQIDLN